MSYSWAFLICIKFCKTIESSSLLCAVGLYIKRCLPVMETCFPFVLPFGQFWVRFFDSFRQSVWLFAIINPYSFENLKLSWERQTEFWNNRYLNAAEKIAKQLLFISRIPKLPPLNPVPIKEQFRWSHPLNDHSNWTTLVNIRKSQQIKPLKASIGGTRHTTKNN